MAPISRPANCSPSRLLIFAKAPISGKVKTRLMPHLSAAECARLHRRLIVRTIRTAITADLGMVELWCAPECGHPFFTACARHLGVALRVQQGEDLGQRMNLALEAKLKEVEAAIIIGCDCPALDARYLKQANNALTGEAPVVLGPAEDGGYVLIGVHRAALIGMRRTSDNGVRRIVPKIFKDIAWGGPTVLTQTRERLRACGLHWRELAPLWDIDRPADLARLRAAGFRLPGLGDRQTTAARHP